MALGAGVAVARGGGGGGGGCGERPRACIQGLGPKSELVSRSPAYITLKLYHAICTSLMN